MKATFRRSLTPGGTYFFTVNTYRRQRILTEPRVYTVLKMAVQRVKASYSFDIKAFVLLPDHLHCLWRLPQGDMNYSLRWNLIKRQVSQAARDGLVESVTDSRAKRRAPGLWQRRFWEHQIRNEDDFMRHVDYIHLPLPRISATAPALLYLPPSVAVACARDTRASMHSAIPLSMAMYNV